MKPAGDSRGEGKVAAVTGATGFVGGKLAGRLADEGFSLRCLVREKSDTALLRSLGAELVRGDLEDEASLRSLPAGCDCVFHVAAKVSDWGRREDFFRQNVEATRMLLDASVASGVRRFVHMSSSTVTWNSSFFAPSDLADIDETHPYPQSYDDSYNETKALSEKLVMEYNGKGGLETVAVRPSQVWGAGDTVILPRLVEASLKGVLVNMGFNEKTMSPCHVLNLAHATLLCASVPRAAGNIYFVNDGESMDKKPFRRGPAGRGGDRVEAAGHGAVRSRISGRLRSRKDIRGEEIRNSPRSHPFCRLGPFEKQDVQRGKSQEGTRLRTRVRIREGNRGAFPVGLRDGRLRKTRRGDEVAWPPGLRKWKWKWK